MIRRLAEASGLSPLQLSVVAVLWTAVYLQSAAFDLVFDDAFILDSQQRYPTLLDGLRSTQQSQMDAVQTATAGFQVAYDSYRPLLFASYWLDRRLSGLDPGWMHIHGVLLGLLFLLVLALLLHQLGATRGERRWILLVTALHPLLVEPVVYVSARGDLLAAIAALLATGCAWRSVRAPTRSPLLLWAAAAALLWFASLLFKEAWIGLPLAFGLAALVLQRLRASIPLGVALVAALLAYAALRTAVLGDEATTLGRQSIPEMVAYLPALVAQAFAVLLVPLDLSVHRSTQPHLAPAGALLLLLGLAGAALLRAQRIPPATGHAALALALLAPLLLPATIAIADTDVVADRYFLPVLPLLAFLLVRSCTLAAERLRLPVTVSRGAAAAFLVGLAALTALQIPTWRNSETLYTRATVAAPEHPMSWYRLGVHHARQHEWETAEQLFARTLHLAPDHQLALNNLGVSLMNQQRWADAEHAFRRTLEVTSGQHYRACFNLGIVILRQGRTRDGCDILEACQHINPAYTLPSQARAELCPP